MAQEKERKEEKVIITVRSFQAEKGYVEKLYECKEGENLGNLRVCEKCPYFKTTKIEREWVYECIGGNIFKEEKTKGLEKIILRCERFNRTREIKF